MSTIVEKIISGLESHPPFQHPTVSPNYKNVIRDLANFRDLRRALKYMSSQQCRLIYIMYLQDETILSPYTHELDRAFALLVPFILEQVKEEGKKEFIELYFEKYYRVGKFENW